MVEVLTTGFYTSVQDCGRFGMQQYGVPVSGAMDLRSSAYANQIIGNDKSSAVLEITMTGPTLKFNEDTVICITGADMTAMCNDIIIRQNRRTPINAGDLLSFGKLKNGFRTYLAILGGFQSEEILNSRSMYANITSQFRIKKNDMLYVKKELSLNTESYSNVKIDDTFFNQTCLDVFKGPEYDQLNEYQQKELVSNLHIVSKDNSRMAYQLDGVLLNKLEPIITSLVMPGTVQLTPSGKLIVLMRDCQATGGYPRVLQLSDMAINVMAQKKTGDVIQFNIKDDYM